MLLLADRVAHVDGSRQQQPDERVVVVLRRRTRRRSSSSRSGSSASLRMPARGDGGARLGASSTSSARRPVGRGAGRLGRRWSGRSCGRASSSGRASTGSDLVDLDRLEEQRGARSRDATCRRGRRPSRGRRRPARDRRACAWPRRRSATRCLPRRPPAVGVHDADRACRGLLRGRARSRCRRTAGPSRRARRGPGALAGSRSTSWSTVNKLCRRTRTSVKTHASTSSQSSPPKSRSSAWR